jgi:TAG lipase/steryl ester hydrolase/phospholipase A2/LPA acyltransferase
LLQRSEPREPTRARHFVRLETLHACLCAHSLGRTHSDAVGVVRALLHARLLPRVVSGSSAGAIGAAMLCTRTDAELEGVLDSWLSPPFQLFGAKRGVRGTLRHLLSKGVLHSPEARCCHSSCCQCIAPRRAHPSSHPRAPPGCPVARAQEYVAKLRRLLGELTFLDAFLRTGRILNIAVTAADTHEPPRLLNYLTAPHVLVWSAVACSSAFPFLFPPRELRARGAAGGEGRFCGAAGAAPGALRRWRDGSLEEDLPMRGLSEMFNVNYFVVAQCNPYLVPVLAAQRLLPRRAQLLVEWEAKHRLAQLARLFPSSRLLKMLCQPWGGDCNFVLPLTTFPLLRAAVNFSRDEILRAMEEGQRAVWAKRGAIEATCGVELAFDAELARLAGAARAAQQVEARAAAGRSARLRGGLPSWLDLRPLGLAANSDSASDAASLPRGSLDDLQEEGAAAAAAEGVAEEQAGEEAEEAEGGGAAAAAAAAGGDGEGLQLEGGAEAFRDLSELALGLDAIAP